MCVIVKVPFFGTFLILSFKISVLERTLKCIMVQVGASFRLQIVAKTLFFMMCVAKMLQKTIFALWNKIFCTLKKEGDFSPSYRLYPHTGHLPFTGTTSLPHLGQCTVFELLLIALLYESANVSLFIYELFLDTLDVFLLVPTELLLLLDFVSSEPLFWLKTLL